MPICASNELELEPATRDFYRQAITILREAKLPFLVGGAYAFGCYTGITRNTKDFDVFAHPRDVENILKALDLKMDLMRRIPRLRKVSMNFRIKMERAASAVGDGKAEQFVADRAADSVDLHRLPDMRAAMQLERQRPLVTR